MSTAPDDMLADAVGVLLADRAPPAAVRRAEAGGLDRGLWAALTEAGFDRALAPEALGGSGLAWADVRGLWQACGRAAAPAPLAEAVLAHGLAGLCGQALPAGVLSLGAGAVDGDCVVARAVPWGADADFVLAVGTDRAWLLPVAACRVTPHGAALAEREVDLACPLGAVAAVLVLPAGVDGLAAGAALRSAQIAGALEAVLALTLGHAGDRRQFGRALGQFQAVQQQLAVLAEDLMAARMAAALACQGAGPPAWQAAAAAKLVAGEAAARAAAIAQAVHGAIGITAEHDLSLYSRRLLAWRLQFGGDGRWAAALGADLLARPQQDCWQYARAIATG